MAGSKRQRELARRRAQRQAERRAEAARKRRQRLIVTSSGVGVLLIILVVFLTTRPNDDKKSDAAATPTPTPSASAAPDTCAFTASEGESGGPGLPPASGFDKKPRTGTLTLTTGKVTIALASDKAPCTVSSFEHLAAKKYFDGTKCHRLTTGGIFVLQCGDPTGSGGGGPGYQFPDENLSGAKYPAGTVAMANSGKGTNGSQFFLVYKDTELPPNYTPFGTITSGLDVVAKIGKLGTKDGGQDGAPKNDVIIKSFTVASAR